MNARLLAAAGLAVLAAQPLAAQANTCPAGSTTNIGGVQVPDRERATQDACQMAVDIFQLMAPQFGLALSGGNATLGQGGTLGGLGHFSFGIRGNVFAGDTPDITTYSPSTSGRQQRELATERFPLGAPVADAAIGIFKGIPLGLTNVGGVDLLVSAVYIPSITRDEVSVQPESNLKLGFGARLGLLQESLLVPGVSFSYLRRDLPRTNILGRSPDLDVDITNVSVETAAWRLVASKSFLIFGLAAGAGQDRYTQGASVQATVKNTPIGSVSSDVITLSQDLTRTNYFLDLSMNLPFIKLVGEVGRVAGGSLPPDQPYNTFSGGPVTKARTYGSVGLRIGF